MATARCILLRASSSIEARYLGIIVFSLPRLHQEKKRFPWGGFLPSRGVQKPVIFPFLDKWVACLPAGMARNIGVEVYLPPELVDALDERVENRSAYVRELIADDLGVSADA